MKKFFKTSLQLSPMVLHDLEHWPGLTQSEALRLLVERGHYLSSLKSEEIAGLALEYAPILREALQDLGYEDYRLAARSLPAIVSGFLAEENRSWIFEQGDQHELLPSECVEKLASLNSLERIGILDCVVAERSRRAAKVTGPSTNGHRTEAPTASDFEQKIRELWALSEANGHKYVEIKAGDLHRSVGGYPAPKEQNRMPVCCQVMSRLKQGGDKVENKPPSGTGASLIIRYSLPRRSRD